MYIAEGTYLGTAGTRASCGMSWGLNYTYTGPGLRLAKPSLWQCSAQELLEYSGWNKEAPTTVNIFYTDKRYVYNATVLAIWEMVVTQNPNNKRSSVCREKSWLLLIQNTDGGCFEQNIEQPRSLTRTTFIRLKGLTYHLGLKIVSKYQHKLLSNTSTNFWLVIYLTFIPKSNICRCLLQKYVKWNLSIRSHVTTKNRQWRQHLVKVIVLPSGDKSAFL